MDDQAHEKRLREIEAECAELRRQILKLEFRSKKDAQKAKKESDEAWERLREQQNLTQRHLDHITKLARISLESVFEIDERIGTAGRTLSKTQSE